MIGSLRNNIILNAKNVPGWRTRRKLVIIECDDWGSIRMPSKRVFNSLEKLGLNVNTSRYNRVDTLESSEDLEQLYAVLLSARDCNNRPAVMTPVTIMANPDFEKIRYSDFSEYYPESFIETLNRYYPNDAVFKTWQQGISEGIFSPELHGREHISVAFWMNKLREKDKDLHIAFDHGFVSLLTSGVPKEIKEFRPEFYFDEPKQKPFLRNSIKGSTDLYYKIFGFRPLVFVPSNGIFHPEFEAEVANSGLKFLFATTLMRYPDKGRLRKRLIITGYRNSSGLIYYTRNCAFEPTDGSYRGIGFTLKQIEAAFRWGKPANISTHRVNFIGGISPENRELGLSELKKLLKEIVKRWPDVEFMSSREAHSILASGK